MELKREQQALLVLLRAGLWEREIDDDSCFPLSEDGWLDVYKASRQQTVTGLVYHGLLHLPEKWFPSMDLLVRWTAEVDRIEQENRKKRCQLAELLEEMKKQGMAPVLQKGEAVARMYDFPLLRESGDVDLYFPDSDSWNKATTWAECQSEAFKKHSDHSCSYRWKDLLVEHHSRLIDLYSPRLKSILSDFENSKGFTGCSLDTDKGQEVKVPAPELDLLMLNAHILKHVLGPGIGLRQLCDMARAIVFYKEKVSAINMLQVAQLCGIDRWTRVLFSFLKIYLGLEMDLSFKLQQSEELLQRVLEGGNFGFHAAGRQESLASAWKSKWYTFTALCKNSTYGFSLAPGESFWTMLTLMKGQLRG